MRIPASGFTFHGNVTQKKKIATSCCSRWKTSLSRKVVGSCASTRLCANVVTSAPVPTSHSVASQTQRPDRTRGSGPDV